MPPIKPGFPFCSRVPISIHPIVAGLLLFGHLFGTEAERLPRVDRRRRGRPATAVEIRRLIERMVAANPLWRAAQASRRVEDARYPDLRDGLPNSPYTPPAAESDLEGVSSQPHRSIGVD